jgi:hypothetical protein
MPRVNIYLDDTVDVNFTSAGTNYIVQTAAGTLYYFYIDGASDVVYRKSIDGGLNWSAATVVFTGTATQLSVWYDRWSGISGDLIHVAYSDSGIDDVLYRNLDTSSDTLSSQTTVAAGTSTAGGGGISICRSRGGNLLCALDIDNGTERGVVKSTDVGATWPTVIADPYEGAAGDMLILLPGWAADNQDMMALFWDASANEISRKLYDDSANSWSETSIAASMTDVAPNNSWPHFAAAVDLANSRNVLVAWSGVDTANADLRCWTVTEGAITEVTNVVTGSGDDQGLCGIAINTVTQEWYVAYIGKSDGSETYPTAVRGYYKVSNDAGSTWSAEIAFTEDRVRNQPTLHVCPRFFGRPLFSAFNDYTGGLETLINVDVTRPRANYLLGM